MAEEGINFPSLDSPPWGHRTLIFMRANVRVTQPRIRFQACTASRLNPHALQTIATPLQWVAFRLFLVFLDAAFFPYWDALSTNEFSAMVRPFLVLRGIFTAHLKAHGPGAEGDAIMMSRSRDDACISSHSAPLFQPRTILLGIFAGSSRKVEGFREGSKARPRGLPTHAFQTSSRFSDSQCATR